MLLGIWLGNDCELLGFCKLVGLFRSPFSLFYLFNLITLAGAGSSNPFLNPEPAASISIPVGSYPVDDPN